MRTRMTRVVLAPAGVRRLTVDLHALEGLLVVLIVRPQGRLCPAVQVRCAILGLLLLLLVARLVAVEVVVRPDVVALRSAPGISEARGSCAERRGLQIRRRGLRPCCWSPVKRAFTRRVECGRRRRGVEVGALAVCSADAQDAGLQGSAGRQPGQRMQLV